MIDGIMKGEGNSRFLRSPSSIPETWEAARAQLIAGTFPIDLLINLVGWDVLGTLLSKANLFSDATAALYGLTGENATVNNALAAILAEATTSLKGLMSAADKTILDGLVTEIQPVNRGGTGKTTAADAIKALGLGYATCSTAAGTAAKVGTISNFSLVVGGIVGVLFTNINTAANPTVNLNSTGAKPIYLNGAAVPATKVPKFALLQYDGTNLNLINADVETGLTALINGVSTQVSAIGTDKTLAYASSNQGLSNDVWANLTFASEAYDTLGLFSVAEPTKIIFPSAGKFRITVSANVSMSSGYNSCTLYLEILKNGAAMTPPEIVSSGSPNGPGGVFIVSQILSVAANDYFQFRIKQSGYGSTGDPAQVTTRRCFVEKIGG